MRNIVASLLFALAASEYAHGQTPVHKELRPVQPPPLAASPNAGTRQSTALSAAANRNEAPLQQLPDFAVVDRDGKPVDAQSLSHATHWLLLYRRPVCTACDTLMASVAQTPDATFQHGVSVVVIIAGPEPNALAQTQEQFPQWSGAIWVADPHGDAFRALKLSGVPVLFAMHGNSIAFRIAGTLGDPATVCALASSWLANPEDTTPSATAKTTP